MALLAKGHQNKLIILIKRCLIEIGEENKGFSEKEL
jgi:hypothetical protein